MARSVVLWNDYKGSQEVITLENGRLAQQIIDENKDTWNLASTSVQQNAVYNGVRIDSANGILVTTTNTLLKMNASTGIEIYNNKSAATDKRVFYIDTNGNINLTGNITMTNGSISWANITAPSFSQITGTKPTQDANNTFSEMSNNANIKGMFVNQSGKLVLNADAILAGKIQARYVTVGGTTTYETGYSPKELQARTDLVRVRYVRDWTNGSSMNTSNHWSQIKVMRGTTDLAAGKTVTGSQAESTTYPYSRITDGSLGTYGQTSGSGASWVQIDLGQVYNDLDYIHVWHYYNDGRTYNGTKTEVSDDGTTWLPLFDSAVSGTYQELDTGFIIPVNPGKMQLSTTTKFSVLDGQISSLVTNQSATDKKATDAGSLAQQSLDKFTQKVWMTDVNALGSSTATSFEQTNGQIALRVKTEDYNKDIGLNSWFRRVYAMQLSSSTASKPSFDLIAGKTPAETGIVADGTSLPMWTTDYFFDHFFTNVYVSAAKAVTINVTNDDGITIFLNGAEVYTAFTMTTAKAVTLNLLKGWNTIDILHYEHSGGQSVGISPAISTQVEKMVASATGTSPADSRLINAETSIIANKAEIALRAKQDDFTALSGRVGTAEQKITPDAIMSTVSGHSTYQSAMNARLTAEQIKGLASTNLVHNSEWLLDTSKWNNTTGWVRDETVKYYSSYTMKIELSGLTADAWRLLQSEKISVTPGEKLIGSWYTMTDDITLDDRGYSMEIEYFDTAGTRIATGGKSVKPSANNQWERFVYTSTAPANAVKADLRVHPVRNGRFWVARPFLGRGDQDMGWSPHVDELATELSASMKVQAGKISMVVTDDNVIRGDAVSSSITQTPTALDAMVQAINLTGKVTFSAFDSAAQTKINKGSDAKDAIDTNSGVWNRASNIDANGYLNAAKISGKVTDAQVNSASIWNNAQGSLVTNPIFTSWTGSYPTGFGAWYTAPTKETTLTRNGGNAIRWNVTTESTDTGANFFNFLIPKIPNMKYLFVELDFMLVSGSIDGSGLLFDWAGMTPYRSLVSLKDYIPSPELGKWYTLRTVVRRPTDVASELAKFTALQGYLMANYAGFSGSPKKIKDIIFDRLMIREPTEQEWKGYENAILIANSQSTWDRASNINSDGTFNSSKLNGSIADGQIASASSWNTAMGKVTGWAHPSDTTVIDGGKIYTGSIDADKLTTRSRKSGLIGFYYDGYDFNTYIGQQIDPNINFSWGSGKPAILPNADNFSIRWQGMIYCDVAGTYTFEANIDDYMKLTVGTTIVVNKTMSGTTTGTFTATANTWYPIVIEFKEKTGTSVCILSWTRTGKAKEVIPTEYFSPGMSLVDGGQILTGSIQAGHIASDAVTADKIAANSITATKIKAGEITADKMYFGGNIVDVAQNKPVTVSGGTLINGGPTSSRYNGLGYWGSTGAVVGSTMTVDLGATYNETRYISFSTYYTNDARYTPKGYTIAWSTDNSTWTNVITVTNNTSVYVYHGFTAACRYVRLTIDAPQDGYTYSNISRFQVGSMQGGTVINGDNIRAGTIDADVVTVKNIKADAITVGSATKYESGYDPTEVQKNLDTLVVGGENLLLNTQDYGAAWVKQGATPVIDTTNPFDYCAVQIQKGDWNYYKHSTAVDMSVGKTYTISAWIRADVANVINVYATTGANGLTTMPMKNDAGLTRASTEWTRFSKTFLATADINPTAVRIEANGDWTTTPTQLYIAKIKLEEGSKATTWTPSIKDTWQNVDNINQKMEKIATNGLSIKPDYSDFSTAATGSMYFHGFNGAGDAADVDGYILINAQKVTVAKGVLKPGVTGDGYIMYDTTASVWYFAQYEATTGTWKKYNVGKTGTGTSFVLSDTTIFIGSATI